MRIAVRPSAVLIARQPSRSQPRSVSINRRTSFVGERSASKRRRLERNSSCSLEKLNFTELSRVRVRSKCERLLPSADCRDGPIDAQFPAVLVTGRQHGNRKRRYGALELDQPAKVREFGPLLATPKRVILEVTAPGIARVSSRRNGDESHRTLPLRPNQLRGRDRPDPGQDLPLHRLSNPHRHGVSHERVELARHLCPEERNTEDLLQDG